MAHEFNKLVVAFFTAMMAILMAALITEARRPSILQDTSLSALPPYNLHEEAGRQVPSESLLLPSYNFHEQALRVGRQVPTGPLPLLPPQSSHEQAVLGTCQAFNIDIDNHADGQAWLVQIANLCTCSATHVILNCPNFSSGTHQIDPEVLTINGDGTCTVKKGRAVTHGEIISFKYYQVLSQPLSVRSVDFGC